MRDQKCNYYAVPGCTFTVYRTVLFFANFGLFELVYDVITSHPSLHINCTMRFRSYSYKLAHTTRCRCRIRVTISPSIKVYLITPLIVVYHSIRPFHYRHSNNTRFEHYSDLLICLDHNKRYVSKFCPRVSGKRIDHETRFLAQ